MTAGLFFALAWKSSVVCGSALVVARASRHRGPADRVLILKAAVLCLLLLPLLTIFIPATKVTLPALPSQTSLALPPPQSALAHVPAGALANESIWRFALLSYGAGVTLLIGYLILGMSLLARWTGAAREIRSGTWREVLIRSCGGTRPPKLLACRRIASPVSWGIFDPTILVDERSLAQDSSAAAVIAHELAHIRNRDWPTLILARLAVALLWCNPLVWLLAHALEQEMEETADQAAAQMLGVTEYAQVLVLHGRRGWAPPMAALAMAARPGRLSRRIRSLLGRDQSVATFRTAGQIGIASSAAIAVLLVASLGFASTRAASPHTGEEQPGANDPALIGEQSAPRLARPVISGHRSQQAEATRSAPHRISRTNPGRIDAPVAAATESETDSVAQMNAAAAVMDEHAAAVEMQARTLRDQSSSSAIPIEARKQAQQQSATLESAAAALRLSAAGTRANAIALGQNQQLERKLAQAP